MAEVNAANSGQTGISDSRLMNQWYDALREEDCVKVQSLLNEDVNLVHEGWKADVQSSVPRLKKETRKPSEGCTALHVAARRGDVKLVRRILEMTSTMTPELKDCFLEVKHPDYKLDAVAMAVINGNMGIVKLLRLAATKKASTFGASEVGDTNPFKQEELALQKISEEVLDEIHSEVGIVKKMFDEDRKSKEKEDIPIKSDKDLDRDDGSAGTHEVGGTSAGSEKKEDLDRKLGDRPFDHWFRQKIGYDEDCDFNFLDFHLYLFHFTFTGHFGNKYGYLWSAVHHEIQTRIYWRAGHHGIPLYADVEINRPLVHYLVCELKDGQGRTPLHIAVDSGVDCSHGLPPPIHPITRFFEVISHAGDEKFVNARDSVGRTPLHRAAGLEDHSSLRFLLDDGRTDVRAEVTYRKGRWQMSSVDGIWKDDLDINKLSLNNGFRSGPLWHDDHINGYPTKTTWSAFHLAIIHKHAKHVKILLQCWRSNAKELANLPCFRRLDTQSEEVPTLFHPFQSRALHLAALVDDTTIFPQLFQICADTFASEEYYPSFFIAAAKGSPSMVKQYLDSNNGQFDPFIRGWSGRTALHFAMERKPIFYPHLLDFVSCQHVLSWRRKNYHEISGDGRDLSKEDEIKEQYGQRKGCVISLLQAGIDIWAKDTDGMTASPGPDAPEDFVTWWYEKVVQETEKVQKNLNDAANAITVTAALVATTSYVGPLQPPLSYAGNPSGVQVHIASVRVFIVCDTISFYLALAAIMLALLPTLPQPRQSIFTELRRTRMLVALAVTCLFPSIISVLIAFAASSIAVVPDQGLSYHGVSIATAAVGGLICFLVIGWFSSGLFKVLKTIPVIETTLMALIKLSKPSRMAFKNFVIEQYYNVLYFRRTKRVVKLNSTGSSVL